jgi:hypothetical protein
MKTLTRRAFGTTLLSAGAIPLVRDAFLHASSESDQAGIVLPESVAGYVMTEDERKLALKFLENHERNMKPLREHDLPNDLAPSFIFASPILKGETGESEQ